MSWPCSRSRSGCPAASRSSSAVSASCLAKRQVSLDPGLEGGEPQVFQAHGLRLNERVVGQVSEHLAPPQIQRLAQRPGTLRVPARFQRSPPGDERVLEPRRIQVLAIHAEQVATAPGHQHAPGSAPEPARLKRAAQVEHVGLQGGDPPIGRVTAPDLLGQPVHRYGPVRLQQQQRQHRPLPRAAQRHGTTGPPNLQRPQNAELREPCLAGHRVSSHHPPRPVVSRPGKQLSTIPSPARRSSKPLFQAGPKAIPVVPRCCR